MKFTLEIELENDATFASISAQLTDFAWRLKAPALISGVILGTCCGNIPSFSDSRNTVGKWEVVS